MAARTAAVDSLTLAVWRVQPQEGRTLVNAAAVKEWGRANGFQVPAVQGRMSDEVKDAYNAAHAKGKNPKQYVETRTAQPGQARQFTYLPQGARKPRTFEATLAEVRTWANANGHTVADRGRIPQSVIEAYGVAQEKPRKPRKPRAAKATQEPTDSE